MKEIDSSIQFADMQWLCRSRLPDVLRIEKQCFEYPWNEDDLLRCMRTRNTIGMVADHMGHTAGFVIYELHKNRLHILNLAVDPLFHRKSVGSIIVSRLIDKLSYQRRNRITVEVRETNVAAQMFFKKLGFRAISILRGYYDDSDEDAYLMQYTYSGLGL
jgi:ribosomal-protein-alanine N-acetyltransferase